MQLFLNLLQFPHQIELSLRTPEIEHSMIQVRGSYNPGQPAFIVYLRLHGRREALCEGSEHAGGADARGDSIRGKLSLTRDDRDLFFLFIVLGEVQERVKEVFVWDLEKFGYQLVYVNFLVAHTGLRGSGR